MNDKEQTNQMNNEEQTSQMDEKLRMVQVERWLRLIERTRLLCNTAEELGQLVGFSVNNRNSLARKGGNSLFMKEAIFHQLAHICQEEADLDLQTVVEAYEEVDRFVDKYEVLLRDKTVLPQIVELLYGCGETEDDLSFVSEQLEVKHGPILVLMLLGCLPRLSAKNGDVQDIMADFQRTFDFLHQVCHATLFQTIPVLTMIEGRVADDPTCRSRLHLIEAVSNVLNAYGIMSTRQRLSIFTRDFLENQYFPDIEGIWTEDDNQTAFWFFERISNGFFMYHYTLKDSLLYYTKYFASFYGEDEEPLAVVGHPKLIRYIVQGKPIPKNISAYLFFEQDDDELRFISRGKDSDWLGLEHLKRSKHAKFYQSLLDDECREHINEYAQDDYEMTAQLVAITEDAIYLSNGEQAFYRVPKSLNEVLEDIHFGDNVGVLTFADATYLAFDDKSLYYDVTTTDKMKEYGIELVDSITV